MRRWIAVLVPVLAFAACAADYWEKDYEAALAAAQKDGRAVLVKFYCTT